MTPDFLVLGLLWYVVFLFSTVCHEASHALVGKWQGDLTAFNGGQVTLNPIPHIRRAPVGMVLIPIVTYLMSHWMMGWASAPYDPYWARQYPRKAAKMALAGPAANFALVILAGIAIQIGLRLGLFVMPESISFSNIVEAARPGAAEAVAQVLSLLFSLNVLLGSFNLIPLPPLDGFNVIPLLLSDNAARGFLNIGESIRQYSLVGILLSWRVFDVVYPPIFTVAIRALYH